MEACSVIEQRIKRAFSSSHVTLSVNTDPFTRARYTARGEKKRRDAVSVIITDAVAMPPQPYPV